MQDQKIPSPYAISSAASEYPQHPALPFQISHLIEYFGVVNYGTNERVLASIKESLINNPDAELTMLVTSAGGPSGTAMSFYDTVRHLLRPRLTTIGSGDVDSSGAIIFLTGSTRFVTPHTTMLLHPAGRNFESGKRFTAAEIAAMAAEDAVKDEQYASLLAENSNGKLAKDRVLELMSHHTVLEPRDMVECGLAHEVLSS